MNEHVKRAMELRNEVPLANNCTQAVMRVYAKEMGMDEDLAAAIGCNFGKGMRCGATCGAITGGLMVLGAMGLQSPEIVAKFRKGVAQNHDGMTDCVDLLRENAQKGGRNKEHCDNLIREAIEMVDKLLEENL